MKPKLFSPVKSHKWQKNQPSLSGCAFATNCSTFEEVMLSSDSTDNRPLSDGRSISVFDRSIKNE